MSFFKQEQLNAMVNIAAKLAVGLVPLLFVPVYVRSLGMHGYGVFAYALTLVGLASLFDFGLSPAITRAFSQEGAREKRAVLFKAFEVTYLILGSVVAIIAIGVAAAAFGFSGDEAPEGGTLLTWLSTAAVVACSWPVNLYSGALLGADQQIKLNLIAFSSVILRFGGGAVLLVAFGPNPVYLLIGHAAGFLMTAVLLRRTVRACTDGAQRPAYSQEIVRKNLGFAVQTWIVVGVGVLCAQLDKQVIATSMGLAVFSSYAIAWTLSTAALNLAHPIGSSYYPRAVAAFEAGDLSYVRRAVADGLALITVLILAPCAVAASFASDLLILWLGGVEAQKVEPFLIPLLHAAQLGALSALAQSFLTAFGLVGRIVLINLVQLGVMAVGIVIVVFMQDASPVEIAYLWVVVQGIGAVVGVYFVGRAVNAPVSRCILGVAATVAVTDLSAWAVNAAISNGVPSLARLVFGVGASCAMAVLIVFTQRWLGLWSPQRPGSTLDVAVERL